MTITRLYDIRPKQNGCCLWARIWITDDGSFSTISDHGNWGYWWGSPGCEFRQFLIGCEPGYYITTKLADGARQFDGQRSVKLIREHIVQRRRSGSLSRDEAAYEWSLVHPKPPHSRPWEHKCFSHMDNEIEAKEWYDATHLADASELLCYGPPIQLQMFIKHLWPGFIEQLKAELEAEREQASLVETLYGGFIEQLKAVKEEHT